MPGPFDLDPSMAVEPLDVASLGGTPPFVPQTPAKGQGWKELGPLAALLPIIAARGKGVGIAAFLQGMQQAKQRAQQEQRQGQIDARAQAQQTSLDEYRTAQLAQQRQQQQITFLDKLRASVAEVDDPAILEQYRAAFLPMAQTLGIDPGAVTSLTSLPPSKLQQRAAEKRIAALKSQFGADKWMAEGAKFTHEVNGEQVPFTELLRRSGMTADPLAPASAPKDKRAFQTKDITVNGKRILAGYDPDTNLYYAPGSGTPLTGEIQEYNKPIQSGGGASKSLTLNQRANVIGSRRSQWQRFAKAVTDRQTAIAKIDSGVSALDRGNRNAATQTIIIAFNKLLDETSVVREGEYARTEQLVPLVNRIEGAIQRITLGGASMKDEDLRALAREATAIASALEAVSNEAAANLRQGIEEELADYDIPSTRVFGGSTIGTKKAAPRVPTEAPPQGPAAPPPTKQRIGRFEVEVTP